MLPIYRAWHKELKKMFSPEELGEDQLTLMPNGRGFVNVSSGSTKLSEIDDGKKMVPLLFIGRLDEDGKKIFEGDILEDHYWNSIWFTRNMEVRIPDIYLWLDSHKDVKGSYYKVIGNIYENPKLLDEQ